MTLGNLELSPFSTSDSLYPPPTFVPEQQVEEAVVENELDRNTAIYFLEKSRVKTLEKTEGRIGKVALAIAGIAATVIIGSLLFATSLPLLCGIAVIPVICAMSVVLIAAPLFFLMKNLIKCTEYEKSGELIKKLQKNSNRKLGSRELVKIIKIMKSDMGGLAELVPHMNFRQLIVFGSLVPQKIDSLVASESTPAQRRCKALMKSIRDTNAIKNSNYVHTLIKNDVLFRHYLTHCLIENRRMNDCLVSELNSNGEHIVSDYDESKMIFMRLDPKLNATSTGIEKNGDLICLVNLLHELPIFLNLAGVRDLIKSLSTVGYIPRGVMRWENFKPLEQETKDKIWALLDREITENAALYAEEDLYELVQQQPEFKQLCQYCERAFLTSMVVVDDKLWDKVVKIAEQLSSEAIKNLCSATASSKLRDSQDVSLWAKRAKQVMNHSSFLELLSTLNKASQAAAFMPIVEVFKATKDQQVRKKCMQIISNIPISLLKFNPNDLPQELVDYFFKVGAI